MSRKLLSLDMFDLAQLLVSNDLVKDAKSLFDTSSKLFNMPDGSDWDYECGNLQFHFEGSVSGSIPQQIEYVEIFFNISLHGEFYNDEKVLLNPLNDIYNFDIELIGWNTNAENFFGSWHLDKKNKSSPPSYIHPEYHLTFGGNKLEAMGNIFGSALILPSPRIVHPPMDVILGIDFILRNYFPLDRIKDLIDDSRYVEIISNAHYRLWRPYYLSLASKWHQIEFQLDSTFSYSLINPHLYFG